MWLLVIIIPIVALSLLGTRAEPGLMKMITGHPTSYVGTARRVGRAFLIR